MRKNRKLREVLHVKSTVRLVVDQIPFLFLMLHYYCFETECKLNTVKIYFYSFKHTHPCVPFTNVGEFKLFLQSSGSWEIIQSIFYRNKRQMDWCILFGSGNSAKTSLHPKKIITLRLCVYPKGTYILYKLLIHNRIAKEFSNKYTFIFTQPPHTALSPWPTYSI